MGGKRIGASKVADVPADILAQLNKGLIETATLAETLATDFDLLFRSVFPELKSGSLRVKADAGVTVRMATAGDVLANQLDGRELERARTHGSDIVRGWVAYASAEQAANLHAAIEASRPFAADRHFGVREWAWLCVRPRIVADPTTAIDYLTTWAGDADPNIRRFSVEAIRPRGVWATHISLLKAEPAHALPVLDQLCDDRDDYVHRSVANWMRDAAKTAPDWVEHVCGRWAIDHPGSQSIAAIRKRSLG